MSQTVTNIMRLRVGILVPMVPVKGVEDAVLPVRGGGVASALEGGRDPDQPACGVGEDLHVRAVLLVSSSPRDR
jgi:hypothetical protein